MPSLQSLSLLCLLSATASLAHFTLDWPTTRGFEEDIEDSYCGGFKDVTDNRTAFPLDGTSSVAIDAHHAEGFVAVLLSLSSDPSDFNDFDTSNLLFNYTDIGQGSFCLQVTPSDFEGVSNGTEATILVQYNGGDGSLYQCADIVFSSDASGVPSDIDCSDKVESSDVVAESQAATETDNSSGAVKNVLMGSVGALALSIGSSVLLST